MDNLVKEEKDKKDQERREKMQAMYADNPDQFDQTKSFLPNVAEEGGSKQE